MFDQSDPGKKYNMTQVELAESVFAKLAENSEFIPEPEEIIEIGKIYRYKFIFIAFIRPQSC